MLGLSIGKKKTPKNILDKDGDLAEGQKSKKRDRKKKELLKPWTAKDRTIVAASLLITMLLGVYFWHKGQGRLPEFNFNFQLPQFEEKIILE
ncbi:MAG: hypothetical protein A2782_01180 [Candidatus Blackburnbacteria bacterium RIFCSPHIGHO2_01_FULL_43_15b]|uniref:Uncharacterized protein n=1 Tax=Candidatus Blackburnbacteria bacterium RIFCSPHIGHO2_01_FULL_43_15b TaxID=1797513 RepID=A0A1G1V233_9BACT|nr:MAG: hypothetical protein A2782_01180 [Candidatus Blackburnbacteria bacterium RIFCSPHIGHO2_01_FULL_43_15b]